MSKHFTVSRKHLKPSFLTDFLGVGISLSFIMASFTLRVSAWYFCCLGAKSGRQNWSYWVQTSDRKLFKTRCSKQRSLKKIRETRGIFIYSPNSKLYFYLLHFFLWCCQKETFKPSQIGVLSIAQTRWDRHQEMQSLIMRSGVLPSRTVVCRLMFNNWGWGWEGKLWLTEWANFCGVNTPTLAHFTWDN